MDQKRKTRATHDFAQVLAICKCAVEECDSFECRESKCVGFERIQEFTCTISTVRRGNIRIIIFQYTRFEILEYHHNAHVIICIHAYLHTHTHTCIHKCIHTYIHKYMHETNTHMCN